VIRITDDPIAAIDEAEELRPGEIGELIVRGPQVSPRYVTRTECNTASKISDWHRTGDVGYFDDSERFWYCGRKSHCVETRDGPLFTECVEAIFNKHPSVRRTALVGVGQPFRQAPVLVAELESGCDPDNVKRELIEMARAHKHTNGIRRILIHAGLPVDVRHNAKIHREALAEWAAAQLPELV
jgi:acyl-CoA synthetase (AMP-forming)/AMP-acid ligase II